MSKDPKCPLQVLGKKKRGDRGMNEVEPSEVYGRGGKKIIRGEGEKTLLRISSLKYRMRGKKKRKRLQFL